jgi:hypothetical protein
VKTRSLVATTAAVAATILTLGSVPVGAHPEGGTHVESITATAGATSIALTGTATFVDTAVVFAEDAAGDTSLKGLGTDLVKATIARPNPAKSELEFSIDIADEAQGIFTIPEVIHYSYFFAVGPDAASQWLLMGQRTSQGQSTGSTEPVLNLHQFNADGTCCASKGALAGSMSGGKVRWVLPMSRIQAKAGSVLEPHPSRAIQIQIGASGSQRRNDNQPDQMYSETTYVVPGATVQLGIAPAGTPEAQVPLSVNAGVTAATGAFSGQLPMPATAGTYVVVAKACYGDGNCGIKSTTITV